jgi:hypothetical protein
MPKIVEEFDAKADGGAVYRIIATRNEVNTTHLQSGSPSSLPGLVGYETREGHKVNQIDENTFEIVRTGEMVRRM